MRTQLADLVSPETLVGFEKGNELVPDLCVSWEEAIDARHTQARPPELDASGHVGELQQLLRSGTHVGTDEVDDHLAGLRDVRIVL